MGKTFLKRCGCGKVKTLQALKVCVRCVSKGCTFEPKDIHDNYTLLLHYDHKLVDLKENESGNIHESSVV